MCETCEKLREQDDCVPCRSCGFDTPRDDMWNGKCGACEDEQMVRSIW